MDFDQVKQKSNLLKRYWVLSRNVGKSGVLGLEKVGIKGAARESQRKFLSSLTLARTTEATAARHWTLPLIRTWKGMSSLPPYPLASFPDSVALHPYLAVWKSQAGALDWLSSLGFASRNAVKPLSSVFSPSRKRQALPFPGFLRCRVPYERKEVRALGWKEMTFQFQQHIYLLVCCIPSEFPITFSFIAFFQSSVGV